MYLLYLSSANGISIGSNSQTIVRAELISETKNIVRFYHFRNCGQDQSKLKSVVRFIADFILPLQTENEVDLTIFLDEHELAFDYAAAKENNFTGNKYSEDWKHLATVLNKLKLVAFVKDKGVLSGSMRDELQKYIIAMQKQYNNVI